MKKNTRLLGAFAMIPMIIFLMDLIWGMMKIDIGDTGPASYGWIYVFIGIAISTIIYVIGYSIEGVYFYYVITNRKYYSKTAQFLLVIGCVSYLISMCVNILGYWQVLLPYISLNDRFVQCMIVTLTISTLTIIASEIMPEKDNEILSIQQMVITGVIPVLIVAVIFLVHVIGTNNKANKESVEVKNSLVKDLRKHHISGKVRLIDFENADYNIKYSVTQADTTVYSQVNGRIIKNKYKIEENQFVENKKGTYMKVPGLSKSAQDLKDRFTKQVVKQLKKDNLLKYMNIAENTNDKSLTEYDRPQIYVNNDVNYKKIDQLAYENKISKNPNKQAFDGYTAISFQKAMNNHILVIEVPLIGTNEIVGLSEKAEKKVAKKTMTSVQKMDFSEFPDGYYIISSDVPDIFKNNVLVVKGHKVTRIKDNIGREIIEKFDDD